jgi:hypothetical protein
MAQVKSVILFSNGNTAVFDENGEQMGELQKGWLELWCEFMESKGVDPSKLTDIKTIVNGETRYVQPFKTEFGWNCKFVPF